MSVLIFASVLLLVWLVAGLLRVAFVCDEIQRELRNASAIEKTRRVDRDR